MRGNAGGHRQTQRDRLWLACVVTGALALLYWGYPWTGMSISDSWFLYVNPAKRFTWWTRDQLLNLAPGHDVLEIPRSPLHWSLLFERRGLMSIIVLLINRCSVGQPQVFVNVLCVAVQVVNLLLFAAIVRRLGGGRQMAPILCVAALYPFAAGSRFWQFLIINNLSATCFLISLRLFLQLNHQAAAWTPQETVRWISSLCCLWLSMHLVDYAVFMGPLYVYLALSDSHGRRTLWRFTRPYHPAVLRSLTYLLMSVIVAFTFATDAPSALVYLPRFQELAIRVSLPVTAIVLAATCANAVLFYAGAFFANTLGCVLYPLVFVGRYGRALFASWQVPVAIVLLAAAVVIVVRRSAVSGRLIQETEAQTSSAAGRLGVIGLLWMILAYLPFATAFGYPRTVGLMADRANILALWGTSLWLGAWLQQAAWRTRRQAALRSAVIFGVLGVLAVLWVANLYLQKECYVESYRKEQQVAAIVLQRLPSAVMDDRTPLVLLEKEAPTRFPRAQLLQALAGGGAAGRIAGLLHFLARRYFTQEYISSGFHLDGIMLFGCCPHSASLTFDGYARQWGVQRVPVYKVEPPFQLAEHQETYALMYRNTAVWSQEFGTAWPITYEKRRYQLLRLELGDACFQLRGRCDERLLPAAAPRKG